MPISTHDIRQGLRAMSKNPAFAAVAVLTIALGIGANTAIFSIVHAVLLRPIPYPAEHPDQVLFLEETDKKYTGGMSVAYLNYKDWRDQNQSFSSMACMRYARVNLTGVGEPVSLENPQVTFNYFTIMGIQPLHGRLFVAGEDRPGAGKVALLNSSLWRNRFRADPGVVGSTVRLGDEAYTVVGVLPPNIDLLERERIYTPYVPWAAEVNTHRGDHMGAYVLARLRPGVTFEQAVAEMDTIARRLEQQYPETNSGNRVSLHRYNDHRTRDYRLTLYLLLGAVVLVLLIACGNVANLLLARAVSRRREIAIQSSLGAGRWQIARQSITESLLLSLTGGILGALLGFVAVRLVRGILPENLPRLHQVELNWPVLGYTFAIACLTGLIVGVVPAFQATRVPLGEVLKQAGATAALGGRRRLSRSFLVAETALATVLLIGAGLLVRTIYQLSRVDPGFRTGRLLKMEMEIGSDDDGERLRFFRNVRHELGALPGVESAAISLSAPMMGVYWASIFTVGDKPAPPREDLPSSVFNPVDTGYFETYGIPLKKGRVFTAADTRGSQPVIVINETLARRIWPGEDPIGKRLKQGWPESEGERFPWRVVIGVVGDTKQNGLDAETRMETYIPFSQKPFGYAKLTLRTAVDPRSLIEPAKKAVHQVNPDIPVTGVETMDEVFSDSLAPRRVAMILLMAFAGLAVLLAAVGIYGVIAYSVARRTQEIGVRMALGARKLDVLGLVLRQGLALAAAGALLGVLGAFGVTSLLSHLLYGVSSSDPATFVAVPAGLIGVALLACAVPAIRAMNTAPSSALRYE